MSEKFTSNQDRLDTADAVKDFVTVDAYGKAHVPSGSGSKSGKFLSDHELKMIEAHSSQIYDGMERKETAAMLREVLDDVFDPADASEIRGSLLYHGYIDDEEAEDWSDEEVMNYMTEKMWSQTSRNNSESEKDSTDGSSDTHPKSDENNEYIGKHRAENSAEETPIFETLDSQAREGESLEEYEARQDAKQGGKHKLETVSTEGLDKIEDEKLETVSTDGLDKVDELDEDSENGGVIPRSRLRRVRDAFTTAGASTELSRFQARRQERKERKEQEADRERKKGRTALILGGVAVVAAGVAGYWLMRQNGGSGGGAGGGNFLGDVFGDISDSARDAADRAAKAAEHKQHGSGLGGAELSNVNFTDGSGGEHLMDTMGMDTAKWYRHEDEFAKAFPDLTYLMDDGHIGLIDQNSDTAASRLPKAALEFWKRRS